MNILCAYHNKEAWQTETVREDLHGHRLTLVHSYGDVRTLMTTSEADRFDVILVDSYLPWTLNSKETMPTAFLIQFLQQNLIRGMGIFVPEHFDETVSIDWQDYHALVADKTCWTPTGKRDWARLLELVIEQIHRNDQP